MKRKSMKLISFLVAASLLIGTPAQAVLGQEQDTKIEVEESIDAAEENTEELPEEMILETETGIEQEMQDTEEPEVTEIAAEIEDNLTYISHDGSYKVDGFVCYVKEDNTICIDAYDTAYLGEDKSVVIPEQIDGYPVTEIGEFAFYNEEVQSVVFPSTLTKIGKQAFVLSALESFSFAGDQTVEVGEFAFAETAMVNIVVPANIKNISKGCFSKNLVAKSIVIEEGVETIGEAAFQYNQNATSIEIPSTVTVIGENAFVGDLRVERLELADGVKTIAMKAFDGLEALTAVTLPRSITSIGDEAFRDCNNLVISCYTDTSSHRYAEDNGFDYILLDQPTYTISYQLGGGKNHPDNPDSYMVSTKTFELKEPTRGGYDFTGWYIDAECKNQVTAIQKGSTGNLVLYAGWKGMPYTIRFYGNGGCLSDGEEFHYQKTAYGNSATLWKNAFVRPGYRFEGWNDGSTHYADQASTSLLNVLNGQGTITGNSYGLSAEWTPVSYKVSYTLNGGTISSSAPKTFTVEEYIQIPDPVRSGYEFTGWYTDEALTKYLGSLEGGFSCGQYFKNLTLYAGWEKKSGNTAAVTEYSIVFDGNGATSGTMEAMKKLKYDKKYTLTANAFKRSGYTFTGWNTKKDGSGKAYQNKAEVKNLTSKSGGKVTLYAQWKKAKQTEKKYTITYKLNKGKNNKSNPTSYTKKTATIKFKNAARKGYSFKGWYKDKKYQKKVTQIKKGSTGNVTLYAKWTANQYTIKFNGNGATSGSMKAVKNCKYDKKYTLKKNTFKRKGYTFAGWNTKKDGSGKNYKNKAEVKNLTSKSGGTVTLYAQWKKK